MICCLNPSCQNPTCQDAAKFCIECGTELVILENRYQPLKSIGRGGFGKTYLAADIKKFGEQCVIKQFAPSSGIEAIKLKPNWADAYYYRANIQDDLGNTKQAITDLDKSLNLDK
jgi:serine/threonine protein kinase